MLKSLSIRDLALVESAEVRLVAGLNVLSGETGGGKSLVVTALHLLRGEKAKPGLVRHGAAELRVDGEFALGEGRSSAAIVARVAAIAATPPEGGEILLTRIVDGRGRSRVRVNGRPATLSQLRELGSWLLEIHGQGESRALMRTEIQCEALDAFAKTTGLRERFAAALSQARVAQSALREVATSQGERLAKIELLRAQRDEMRGLGLQAGEVAAVEEEHRLLAHLDRLRELLGSGLADLQDGERNARDLLARARRALEQAAAIDHQLEAAVEALGTAEELIGETIRSAQSACSRLDLDPGRLGEVEARLTLLRRALARYGPEEGNFLESLARIEAELAGCDDDEAGPEAAERLLEQRLGEAAELGRELLAARVAASAPFCAAIRAELSDLGMARTRLEVAMARDFFEQELLAKANASGPVPVELRVRINPGEPFHSLAETASGGELARLVLALKKCLADRDRVPFLVFDEIDAEIGGRLGLALGAKLRELARNHQVLIVTHLPQVAAFADAHLKIGKVARGGRTVSTVELLRGGAVEQELAEMAIGEETDKAAVEEARRLMARARDPG